MMASCRRFARHVKARQVSRRRLTATLHGVVFEIFVCPATKASSRASAIDLQRGDEGFLRDVDLAELPHLLLAFLLLLQKLPLTRDVAAIALCSDVLAQRADRFARYHLAADRRLDRDLEHVRRDQ